MISDLQLRWINCTDQDQPGSGYFDFYISGKPLWELLQIRLFQSVTPFGFFKNKEYELEILKEFRLLQKTQLHGSRIMLYTCNCCGDIGCGAVTAKISALDNIIIWSAFADQRQPEEPSEFFSLPNIVFDRQQYFKTFQSL